MLGKKNISGRGTGGRAEGGSGRGAGRGKDAHARPRPRCGSGPARPPGWGPPPFPTVSRPGGIYLTLASVLRARSPQPLGSRTPGSATPVDSPNEDEFGDEQPTRGHPQLHAARAVWHRGVHRRGGASAVRQKKSGPSRQPGMRVHPRECRSRPSGALHGESTSLAAPPTPTLRGPAGGRVLPSGGLAAARNQHSWLDKR